MVSVFCQRAMKSQIFTLMSSRMWSFVKLGADWLLRFVLCMEREKNHTIDDIIHRNITGPLLFRWHYNTHTEL